MRNKFMGAVLVFLMTVSLLISGCGGTDNTKQTATKKEDFKPAEIVKNLNEKAVVDKINGFIETDELVKAAALGEEGINRYPASVTIPLAVSTVYYYQEDYLDMIKVMRHAVKVSPNNPIALNQLAWALVDSGENVKEGLDLAKKSIKLTQDSGAAVNGGLLDTYGYALMKNGSTNDAIKVLFDAYQETQSTEIAIHLAMSLDKAKQPKAKQTWKNAQDLVEIELKDASSPPAQKRRLEKLKKEISKYIKSSK